MIELTTGIAFLVSSIYGSNQTGSTTMIATTTGTTSPVIEQSHTEADFIDSKAVEAYVKKQYSNEPILIDIARCESTYRQFDQTGNIIRGKVNKGDVGVMQINEHYHADEAAKMGINIYTTEGNVEFGRYLYNKYGSQPWISSSPCWSEGSAIAMK
jgi:hypothetical protein